MGDLKRLNGRPPLTEGKRNRFINVRFTEEEIGQITALEKQLGVSKTDLVRMRTLTNARQTVINAREMITYLDSIGIEMNRIGNNINQLARHANTLNLKGRLDPLVVLNFNALFNEYIRIQQELESALRKVIRAMMV